MVSGLKVVLTQCDDYNGDRLAEALKKQFELLGGLDKFVKKSDTVLLKPNFIAPKSRRRAVQTDPSVLIETARLIKDFGGRPFVGDSPAWSNVYHCARKLKLEEPLKKLGVPIRQLDKGKKIKIGKDGTRVSFSRIALEADVIINLPKLKAHQQLVATIAVKNMYGAVSGKEKAYWHFGKGSNREKFSEFLIEIYKYLNPVLTIVDGITVMEGVGPIRGTPRHIGYLIGSTDAIACELICAKMIGLEPEQLPIIRTAGRLGFGCRDFEEIRIAGDDLPQEMCTDFKIPPLIPVRFSLLYVFKSIIKQIIMLAKSTFGLKGSDA
ncbi:MAG: DUF362 domain-containing protein [Planctomycetota bacterium]|jgi:uncharacterized protein (DUF362 family)